MPIEAVVDEFQRETDFEEQQERWSMSPAKGATGRRKQEDRG
jgi:hypothetical protein